MISIDDFAKLDLRVGKILSVEPVEGSEKLYKEIVDFGPEIGEKQILSGIQKYYNPDELIGKLGIFIVNLEPRMMMGLESQGMLLAVDGDDKPILLTPMEPVKPGAKAK
jgi:methionine--tRNA ligase beta chain